MIRNLRDFKSRIDEETERLWREEEEDDDEKQKKAKKKKEEEKKKKEKGMCPFRSTYCEVKCTVLSLISIILYDI